VIKCRISDFQLAKNYISSICKDHGVEFNDLEIDFSGNGKSIIRNGVIHLANTVNLPHTIHEIITAYFLDSNGFKLMYGKDIHLNKDSFSIRLASILRKYCYISSEVDRNYVVQSKLYRNMFLWSFCKDILSDIYDVKLKNTLVIKGFSERIDVAKYFNKEDAIGETSGKIDCEFIFENLDCNSDEHFSIVLREIFLLIETVKSYNLNPGDVFRNIFNSSAKDLFFGLLKLKYKNDVKNIIYFVMSLCQILDISLDEKDIDKSIKIAADLSSSGAYPSMQMWNLPIIEALLMPVRGFDVDFAEDLENQDNIFWQEVEKVKKERYNKYDGIPFQVLLEIKSDGLQTDCSKTLQSLLSSERTWK